MTGHDPLDAFVPDSEPLEPTGQGRLDSVDIALKDVVEVAGRVPSFGHPLWRDTHNPAATTSPTVTRLLADGGRIAGFAKLDQLAFSIIGNACEGAPPRNPRHPELFCGGSSSGSAALVAGSVAALGVGTDTAGSVRVPAALCGIHALRPTWGRLDTRGVIPLAPSFDTVGLLAAHPSVLRRAFSCLASHGEANLTASYARHGFDRVLVAPSVMERFSEPVRRVTASAAAHIKRLLGAEVEMVELGHLVSADVAALFGRLQGREIWAQHCDWITAHAEALDPDVAFRLDACRAFAAESADDIALDEHDRRRYVELLSEVVTPGAVLVLPVLGDAVPHRDDPADVLTAFRRSVIALMAPASLAGFPQVTWTMPGVGPPIERSVGLLAAADADEDLLDLLNTLAIT